jgi:hypothetical protein
MNRKKPDWSRLLPHTLIELIAARAPLPATWKKLQFPVGTCVVASPSPKAGTTPQSDYLGD